MGVCESGNHHKGEPHLLGRLLRLTDGEDFYNVGGKMHIEEARSFLKNKKVSFLERYTYGWILTVPGRHYRFTFYAGYDYWMASRIIYNYELNKFLLSKSDRFKGNTLEQMYELMAFENYSAITIEDNSAIQIEDDSIKAQVIK